MPGLIERMKSALIGRSEGEASDSEVRAPRPLSVADVVAEGDARAEAAIDRAAEERLRRRVECTPDGVFTLFAVAAIGDRMSGIPDAVPFNKYGSFKGALGVVRRRDGVWRIDGDRRHLYDALKWGLPRRLDDLAAHVLRKAGTEPDDARVAAFVERMATADSVDVTVRRVAKGLPRHALLAALSAPDRALAGLGTIGGTGELIDAVLALGMGIDEPLSDGLPTPLACAAARGDDEAVSALLEAGADPNAYSHGHGPAFDAAAMAGSGEVVSLLSEAGFRFGAVDGYGLNGLHHLIDGPWTGGVDAPPGIDAMHNFRDATTFLAMVEAGANPRQRCRSGETPIDHVRRIANSGDRSDHHFGQWVLDCIRADANARRDALYLGEDLDGETVALRGELRINGGRLAGASGRLSDALARMGERPDLDPVEVLRDLGWTSDEAGEIRRFRPTAKAASEGCWGEETESLLSVLAAHGFEGAVSVLSRDSGLEIEYVLADGALSAEVRFPEDAEDAEMSSSPRP